MLDGLRRLVVFRADGGRVLGLVLLTAASAGIALTMDAIRRPEGGPGA